MNFFLASKLRKASNTEAIEKKRDELRTKFEEFVAFSESEELKDFYELEKEVLSDSFKVNRKQIENKTYKKSNLYKVERDFKRYQRSRRFKVYFRLKDSSELSTFQLMRESDEISRYRELSILVKSASFNRKKQAQELSEFKSMKRSPRIKEYFKFKNSRSYKIYSQLLKSADLKKYIQLEEQISSEAFLEEKKFLLDKKRFEKTEDYQKFQTYQNLKNSEVFMHFFKYQKEKPFEEIKNWKLSFLDEFEENQLDKNKWITRYYWGDKLLNKGFSLDGDLHLFTDGDNIQISNSVLKLIAKKEKKEGLAWNSNYGFIPRDFDYTSAIINTGQSFRQKYGRFEAKIKVNSSNTVIPSFWMLSNKSLPHVDILKTHLNGKIVTGCYNGEESKLQKSQFKVKGIDLSKGYFIYTLDWSENELIWKINDVVVATQKQGIPKVEMYLNFCLSVPKDNDNLNASLDIDWVRCYSKKA
ncbi:glycoside hydrolase family 16 protein [Ancylomarina longa]|uniref:Glycoside hydrolase family 16 protein n=1 Tax=Ancylomarina longa TaxID=2487017 RepID=A0A434AFK3_9BACT|nr:glycoside hydrolase family 16 protein [Ancylomarina longa]RUT73154.1 glycoside hydrolase family 16 protein [Ancylomarina longa]